MVTETAPAATGLLKQVRLASETTYGVPPGATGGAPQIMRRVSSDVALRISGFRSNEIQPDRQVHDFRHGTRAVSGTLRGELSPLTYEPLWAQLLAGSWSTGGTTSGATVTTAAAVADTSPATAIRTAGSWVTDGFKVGDVVRFTGFTSAAAVNNARNLRVTGITMTSSANDTLQLGPTPSTTTPLVNQPNATEILVPATSATGIGCTVVGKKLVTPQAGSLIDSSFSIEHWFSDISQSELFTGCRASRAQVQLPPTAISTVDFDIMGQNVSNSTSAYFTSPAAVTTSGLTASVNGLIRVNDNDYAIVTGANFNINGSYTAESIVGSVVTPYLFPGIQDVSGSLTAVFVDQVLQNDFLNESVIDMQIFLTLNNNLNADFISFYFPTIKLTSGNKDDKAGAIIQTLGFQAIKNVAGGAGTTTDATTISIQDSLAV